MRHEPEQHGCTPKTEAGSLITEESAKQYLKACGLGNYANEIYQDMHCRLVRVKRGGRSLSPEYAFVILRNLVRDKLKDLRKEHLLEKALLELAKSELQEQQQASPEEIAMLNELKREICRIIKENLTLRQRAVINLRFFSQQKFTFKMIGQIIGFSEATARVEYHKALRYIKARLNAEKQGERQLQEKQGVEVIPTNTIYCPRGKAL